MENNSQDVNNSQYDLINKFEQVTQLKHLENAIMIKVMSSII